MIKNYYVIIIGGGAAGFAAASFAENLYQHAPAKAGVLSSHKVLIIEKNHKPMKKLAITGKGRCNLTNNCDTETILRNIPKNSAFMRSSLAAFTPADAMEFFEELGVPLKTERGGRVFPVSDKASDIADALRNNCNAEIVTNRVTELLIADNQIKGVKCANGVIYNTRRVIVATGGVSYPATGSTGDGYEIARKAGHTITIIKPALVPLETIEDCSAMAGLTLKNVNLTLKKSNKTLLREQGEMLFTHFGVSGPLVLSASMYIDNPCIKNNSSDYTISIDLKTALDEKALDNRILRDFAENKNRQFKNALSGLLPEKIIPVFVQRSEINPEKRVNEITKEERRKLLMLFKDFQLTIAAFRPIDEAVITDGGISVREIDPKTMQSKLVKGLYFAGEVIDVNGFTGGFNLQIAWSTAYAAAKAIDIVN